MSGKPGPILSVRDIAKTYPGGVKAVRGVSFEAWPGEALAVLGPNGAGKTTALRIIAGLALADSGSVEVGGYDINSGRREYLRRIGMVSQHQNVDTDLTAAENMRVHARFFSMPRGEAEPAIEALLRMAGLEERKNGLVSGFSGGMKRRLQIARALLHGPSLLILDEPTTGLDPGAREAVWAFVGRLKREGAAIVFSTHYMDEAEDRADSVLFMRDGLAIRRGPPRELVNGLGAWCVEGTLDGDPERRYFSEKEDAARRLAELSKFATGASMRPTRLEDVYRLAASRESGR